MPITFECPCGRKFRTGDENAGRTATCPDCRNKLIVPAAAVAVPSAAAPVLPPPLPAEQPARPAGAPFDFQSEEVVPVPRRDDRPPYGQPRRDDPYGRYDDDYRRPYYGRDDDIRSRIVKRPPPRSNNMTDGGVLAGLGMMLLGVVITVVGLAVGFLVYVGPWFFIVGIVALVKGIGRGKV